MTQPPLTIIIPTVNRPQLVTRAIDSALAQTVAGVEIIVSDNASTDGTQAVLARYRGDTRLRLFRHEQQMSATEHGNFLIAQATGTYLLGLSDDDFIEPHFADAVLALLGRRPALAFVYTGCLSHYGDAAVPCLTGPETEPGAAFIAAFLAGRREVCWCACVTRLADLRAIGQLPPDIVFGDMYIWTRLAARGDVGCVAAPLAHYTFMSTDNLSSGVPAPQWADETRTLVDGMLAGIGGGSAARRDGDRFVARSTANQFVWNAIRGAGKGALLRQLVPCRRHLAPAPGSWPRVAAALLLPGSLLRRLVLRAAARRARGRQ